MAAHSSILAWEIPLTEEPGRLQSARSQKSWTWLSGSNNSVPFWSHYHFHQPHISLLWLCSFPIPTPSSRLINIFYIYSFAFTRDFIQMESCICSLLYLLFSLKGMFLRFNPVITYITVLISYIASFLFHCMDRLYLIICSPADGHLDFASVGILWLLLLWTHMSMCWHSFISLGYTPRR